LAPRLVVVTEIIAPYRIPAFNALARRPELELHVLFLSENDPVLRQWRVYKDEIRFQYAVLPSWRHRLGKYNVLINRGMQSTLNKIRPNVVMCGGYNYFASWQSAFWAQSRRIPLLLWSESTALDERKRYRLVEFLKARFLSLCTAFVVPGKSSLQYLKDLGVSNHYIFTAPNSVDLSFFSKAAEAAQGDRSQVRRRLALPPRYFLYVGRLVRAKGVFDLLEAYSRLDDQLRSSIGLVFVGDGPARQEVMERASRVSGEVRFYGFVHREGLPEFYASADALIFPTHSDTWGLVVNEAMSCGLPIIVTQVAGCVADLVEDNWNGFVIPPQNPEQLAEAMARLANDPALEAEMSSRSRERIAAYSPEAWAQGMVNAVGSVCGRQR